MIHSTSHILLVRPAQFEYNAQTAGSNTFQVEKLKDDKASLKALGEFTLFEKTLRKHGVNVIVINDTHSPAKPDAIFPNNWVTFHEDGTVILYPMFAPNRRWEKRPDIIEKLGEKFTISRVVDLGHYESEGRFLEGTGSVIFDHINRISYACISPRTDEKLFSEVSDLLGYTPVKFHAHDRNGKDIYHTNVMMCIAEKFAVVCMESIDEPGRDLVKSSLQKSGHLLLDISISQMNNFAGNMLAVKNRDGEDLLVLSQSAFDSLSKEQREVISTMCKMVPMPINTIETIGGGSARCMMAEVFLPLK